MPLPPPPAKRGARLALEPVLDGGGSAAQPPAPRPKSRVSALLQAGLEPAQAESVHRAVPSTPSPAIQAAAPRDELAAVAAGKSARRKTHGPARLFVLDTNVLLHDPMALFRFEEHDIFLPMIVLEELDAHKKGMTEVARNGRQTSR
ncbi:MAG: PhoH family protein, partial [Burkholderiaceae bacterium]|nr:PhoH family protein [Burkholderiaceae bacterium]